MAHTTVDTQIERFHFQAAYRAVSTSNALRLPARASPKLYETSCTWLATLYTTTNDTIEHWCAQRQKPQQHDARSGAGRAPEWPRAVGSTASAHATHSPRPQLAIVSRPCLGGVQPVLTHQHANGKVRACVHGEFRIVAKPGRMRTSCAATLHRPSARAPHCTSWTCPPSQR